MEMVFLEVQKHQSPVEEAAGEKLLALLREGVAVVRQHFLRGLRAECKHERHRKAAHPRDRTVGFQLTFQELDRKRRHREGVTENWQTFVAWNGLQPGICRWLTKIAPDGPSVQQPTSDYRSTLKG